MPDMLVKLYDLPDNTEFLKKFKNSDIVIRRAIAPEKHIITNWVNKIFGKAWANECEVALCNHPSTCFIAIENEKLIGVACYDATCKDFFGPIGVDGGARGKGVGKALLLNCLEAMAQAGYAYAIIGGVGPIEFYRNIVGAVEIKGSAPGIYKGMLR